MDLPRPYININFGSIRCSVIVWSMNIDYPENSNKYHNQDPKKMIKK